VRLTMDLVPDVKVIVHREGESIESAIAPVEEEEKTEKPKKSNKEEPAAEVAAETAE
ncbi:MAG: hypothetical protein JNM02_15315, partial [Anaerolineales bacterium]|nr:hypothetical protein [Anaerolineales bacterium]